MVNPVNGNKPTVSQGLLNHIKRMNPEIADAEAEARKIGDQDKDNDIDLRDAIISSPDLKIEIKHLTPEEIKEFGKLTENATEDGFIVGSEIVVEDIPSDIPVAYHPLWNAAGYICQMSALDGGEPLKQDRVYQQLLKALDENKDGKIDEDARISHWEFTGILGRERNQLGSNCTRAAYNDYGIGKIRITEENREEALKQIEALTLDHYCLAAFLVDAYKAAGRGGFTVAGYFGAFRHIKVDQQYLADPGVKLYNQVIAEDSPWKKLPNGEQRIDYLTKAYEEDSDKYLDQLEPQIKYEVIQELKEKDPEFDPDSEEGKAKIDEEVEKRKEELKNQWIGLYFVTIAQDGLEDYKILHRKRIRVTSQDGANELFKQVVRPMVLDNRFTPDDPTVVRRDKGIDALTPKRDTRIFIRHQMFLTSTVGREFESWIEAELNARIRNGENVVVAQYDAEGNKIGEGNFNFNWVDKYYKKDGKYVYYEAYKLYLSGGKDEAWNLILSIPQTKPATTGSDKDSDKVASTHGAKTGSKKK